MRCLVKMYLRCSISSSARVGTSFAFPQTVNNCLQLAYSYWSNMKMPAPSFAMVFWAIHPVLIAVQDWFGTWYRFCSAKQAPSTVHSTLATKPFLSTFHYSLMTLMHFFKDTVSHCWGDVQPGAILHCKYCSLTPVLSENSTHSAVIWLSNLTHSHDLWAGAVSFELFSDFCKVSKTGRKMWPCISCKQCFTGNMVDCVGLCHKFHMESLDLWR